ncbi:type I site-specific deoxyribonuclease, HsdR family [Slackia heliotrinireducens]|uniref:Helicase, type I site-specific restriction-modification system restriction subunit n=1 Tax=Slackia heliotrinireducens (strain ATCC 29202 / DSM 20476 / NCTC 11029 / RHS 1) TaxID=471855 RepID=C7N7P0_SLAHD|nr:type I restriction endonuclease [Slackia heliotrinireducens]ACV22925.1 helicase, type I site-specific restriction-modification system restriction subunit [Slackia heliotrinireducens DSM 20476]VEH01744.1 type I site-specific deoxyribonuclease, HsdR family [Slackia heliotrinireducens]
MEQVTYMAVGLPKTTEKNFENNVESMMHDAGWDVFESNAEAQADYDRKRALKTKSVLGFVKETQPEEWAKIEKMYGAKAEERFLKRLCDELEPHDERGGVVNVLRHGIRMAPGAQFRLCFFKPATGKNPDAIARYEANRFELVRQLRYGTLPDDKDNSVDTVLFLNGIPVATMELKNNLSGQRTDHAVKQYKTDRSPKELLFKPNRRAIVHFALDSETVEMCTWLANGKSYFLPFNRGNGMSGAGNPPNPNGYRTEYLYREILETDSLLDIIQRFVRVEYDADTHAMKKIIFPRYHQLDAVRKLVADAKASGAGKSYLIQHSAGSGKSNSIAWLAHHLQSLHDAGDNPVFDTVVILTDRRNLDAQLSETIDSVEHKRGVVVRIREEDGSAGLKEALNSGAQIITSTIQKFPYICSETKVSGRRFAVIIDEAHSSQSGKANAKMKMALIDRDLDPDEPWDDEDELAKEMKAQGKIPNLSFFAFTATPKAATLEVFGTRDDECKRDENGMLIPRPFHLYSMKQAIDEGFILDVLENYTCFESYFKLVKTIADDPKYKEMKANRALMGIAEWSPAMVDRKAQIIVEHFMNDVEGVLGGKSKAMVVTWSRPMAYRLYRAMADYIARERYACEIMVAFSGKLEVDGEELTEASINGVPESRTAELFDSDEKRIIVCANKFQTGFDQPKLCAMYVDKMLTGVAAVQTLSRLNRTCSIPGKRTFVLDFANTWDTIRASFANYYEATELDAATDPDVIYNLASRLDDYHVYETSEVEAVADAYFGEPDPDKVLMKVEARLQPAVDRWKAKDDTKKREFKALLRKFLRSYSFITQMVRLGDEDLHRLFVYGGFLVKKLFLETGDTPDLRDKVELEYLRIEDKGTQAIKLQSEQLHNGGANAGIAKEEEEERLSVLIDHLNEVFGTEWEDADKIIKACADKICEDEDFVAKARTNTMGDLRAIFGGVMMDALAAILSDSQDMFEKFSENPDAFMRVMDDELLPIVYRRCNADVQ